MESDERVQERHYTFYRLFQQIQGLRAAVRQACLFVI